MRHEEARSRLSSGGWDWHQGACRAFTFHLPWSGLPGGRLELTGSLVPSGCQPGIQAGQTGWLRGEDAIGDGQALQDIGDMWRCKVSGKVA